MSESYLYGGDTYQPITPTHSAGQTFRCMQTQTLSYVDLDLDYGLAVTRPFLKIYKANFDGTPLEYPISTSGYWYRRKEKPSGKTRVRFAMEPVLLDTSSFYIMVLSCFVSILEKLEWKYDKGDSPYWPRGWRMLKNETTEVWTAYPHDAHMFAEFGSPPLPKPDPPPPIENFAIPSLIKYCVPDGIVIRLSTSVPCHLTCYHTDKAPLKHHTSAIIRGLKVPWHTYFCFVAWTAVEQNEPGDTLYHSFDLIPWEVCQTRWFTFRGEVDNIPSPSIGPIFKTHRAEVTLPQIFEFYNENPDYPSSIWTNVWEAQTFTPQTPHILSIAQLLLGRSASTTKTLFIEIRHAPDDLPAEPVLSSGSIPAMWPPHHPSKGWIRIPVSPVFLDPGVKYAIVAHTDAPSAQRLYWWRDFAGATYPRGIALTSANAGVTWIKYPDADDLFNCLGYPSCPL